MGRLTLILGGARSGKSTYAQSVASEHGGSVTYIATAQPGDEEMLARIRAHQRQRPEKWITLETPSGVASLWNAQHAHTDLAILDCITFLVTNLILGAGGDADHPDEQKASQMVSAEIEALIRVIQEGTTDWLVVSNEVGFGLVPPYPLGRLFRDLQGWANQRLAQAAGEVYLLVAGIPLPIHTYRRR